MPSSNHCLCYQPTLIADRQSGETRTLWVLWLTLFTMVAEIIVGTAYGSMALLADGWHMGTHVAAFTITLFAYRYARRHAMDADFSFGTGKVSVLGGFASAVALGVVALMMVLESVQRLFMPHEIGFSESIAVAVIGLLVNLASAWLLKDHHSHHHAHHNHHDHHDHHEHHEHHEQDHNLRAAYMHVLADALTSILAIVALTAAMMLGWLWLDALMGIVGATIISVWALGLLKDTSRILLDGSIEAPIRQQIIDRILTAGAEIRDIHIWKISADHYALVLSVASSENEIASRIRQHLADYPQLQHITIEVRHPLL
ncbi:CDF family Co(II)/Ni(II) efflux transporter DmeF [Oceanobacter sp. 4_MG-2023]|uniref:CDF family Co(II)/Ni(II) efflux transporter DmeF n=1 Tax=Oceanobacter sp. 4_MG-2023 TaxID=3062623 RepID=UPI0027325D78|nr:CDF family Co(II)/Ni(II) efflux transporter DmeF [Oceanobacter sp. 4_MG-2023]MDP2548247.1 CDF family Co(II)/Ni(II) efflux transporter DmeF [Oceanobacter sp. 4_MG-2023]